MSTTIYKPIAVNEIKTGQVVRHTAIWDKVTVVTEGVVHSVGNRRSILIGDADNYHEAVADDVAAWEVRHELPEAHGTLVLLDREIGSSWAARTGDNWVDQDGSIVDHNDLVAQFVRVLWAPQ